MNPTKEQVLEAAKVSSEIEKSMKILYPEYFEKPVTYGIGQRFNYDGSLYMLASTDYREDKIYVAMINLNRGSRLNDSQPVWSSSEITTDELKAICGNNDYTRLELIK